jgi:hypothetical protein
LITKVVVEIVWTFLNLPRGMNEGAVNRKGVTILKSHFFTIGPHHNKEPKNKFN